MVHKWSKHEHLFITEVGLQFLPIYGSTREEVSMGEPFLFEQVSPTESDLGFPEQWRY